MLISLFFGFLSGIWIGSLLHFKIAFLVSLIVFIGAFFLYRHFYKTNWKVPVVILFIVGALFGMLRVSFSDLYEKSQLRNFEAEQVEAVGIVVTEPDERENHTKLTVRLSQIATATSTVNVSERVLFTVPLYPQYSYGDKLKVKMVLEKPENFDSGEGRVFDYVGFLRVRGIWYTAKYAKVELLSSGHGAYIKSALFQLKHSFMSSISNALPEPQSSLMGGLLLGAKQSLGKDLLETFQQTGVSHIVVLSGYNIAIVANTLILLLSLIIKSKKLSFGFGVLGIILFTMLAGGGASAVRAAIMVLVALIAKNTGREYKAARILAFAVVLMLAPNPLLLVFDPSFQLSVLATVGLVFVSPRIAHYFLWVTEKYKLREIISTTVATQITVLPFLIYSSGIVSLVSLPVNILILGFIPITMFFGFLTGMFGLVSLYLSFIPALFAYALLWYQLKVIEIGSHFPFAFFNLPAFSPIILTLVYVMIFVILRFINKRKDGSR